MRSCSPRIATWRGTIIAGVGTFWVKRSDLGQRPEGELCPRLLRMQCLFYFAQYFTVLM